MNWIVPAIEAAGAVAKSGIFGGSNMGGGRAQRRAVANWYRQVNRQEKWRDEDYARQKEFARNSTGWAFDDLMESADQAGIHRLAALGGAQGSGYTSGATIGQPATPGPAGLGPSTGDAIGDALGAISDGILRKDQKKRQDAAEKREEELTDAQVDKLEAEAELTRAQSRTTIAQARNGTSNMGKAGAEPEQLMQKIMMPDGTIREIPIGYDIDEMISGLGIFVYDKVRDMWVPEKSKAKPNRQRGSGGKQTKSSPTVSTKQRRNR